MMIGILKCVTGIELLLCPTETITIDDNILSITSRGERERPRSSFFYHHHLCRHIFASHLMTPANLGVSKFYIVTEKAA